MMTVSIKIEVDT